MAWQLYVDVLNHAPADLSSGELVVLLVLADAVRQADYNRGSRRCSLDRAELARLARMESVGINRALQRLATKRGLELRVPLTTGKDGRPVYAVHGRRCVYEIPTFGTPPGCSCTHCTPSEGEPTGHPSECEPGANVDGSPASKDDPQVTLSPPEGSPVGPEGSPTGPERVTHRSAKGDPQVTPTGVTGITGRAGDAPPTDRCPRHSDIPPGEPVPPCRACADARRAAEQWDTERTRIQAEARSANARQRAADRQRAIADCPMCDHAGYIGRQLCDHNPHRADVAARGMARVRAALRQRPTQEVTTDAP